MWFLGFAHGRAAGLPDIRGPSSWWHVANSRASISGTSLGPVFGRRTIASSDFSNVNPPMLRVTSAAALSCFL